MPGPDATRGIALTGPVSREYEAVLTPEALSFVAHLARCYTPRVQVRAAAPFSHGFAWTMQLSFGGVCMLTACP